MNTTIYNCVYEVVDYAVGTAVSVDDSLGFPVLEQPLSEQRIVRIQMQQPRVEDIVDLAVACRELQLVCGAVVDDALDGEGTEILEIEAFVASQCGDEAGVQVDFVALAQLHRWGTFLVCVIGHDSLAPCDILLHETRDLLYPSRALLGVHLRELELGNL